jgi:hypothetical protein
MKLNRLGAFTFGVVITAVSVGAVTFANAAGDVTLKACANKTTGAMRYISKGSCKKTETSLTWSQMGPQGLPGVAGPAGSAGINGAAGMNGSDGSIGPAGPNLKWVDANGNQLGEFLDHNPPQFLYNGVLYYFNAKMSNDYSVNSGSLIYSDEACTIPKGVYSHLTTQEVFYTTIADVRDAALQYWWRPTGVYKTISAGETLYGFSNGLCTSSTVPAAPASSLYRGATLSEVAIYSGRPPSYIAPVLIANK